MNDTRTRPGCVHAFDMSERRWLQALLFGAWMTAVALTPRVTVATDTDLIKWQDWSDDLFARAEAEKRFVILDLEAVWCHWCHVMDQTTYASAQVADLINAHYIPVRVDQDANPDLANRYGDWGWPATIVFAPDGTEIVKRRGYISPVFMISMLDAIVKDPSPGPSVLPEVEILPGSGGLTAKQREQLRDDFWRVYDRENGGWGNVHKFIDLHSLEYALARAQAGERVHELMARQTLNQALLLIDTEWGGIYQYSDQRDWRSPHYEKIMLTQTSAMRVYALAHQLWGSENEDYLGAAKLIWRYLEERMGAPDGGFYTSQDADVDANMDGKTFYAMAAEHRDKLGRQPRIDQNRYARENGWVIAALASMYDATGESAYLNRALSTVRWITTNRRIGDGGFAHGDEDRGGPFLGDNIAMARAFVGLYASTGERKWLDEAKRTLTFIRQQLRQDTAGYLSHPIDPNAVGVFKRPLLLVEENVAVARVANQVRWYSGEKRFGDLAEHAMRYLASKGLTDNRLFLHGVLLSDLEVSNEPVHITVVGAKSDKQAQALHAAARRYPGVFKRLEWWDRSEGPLPNADVKYPKTPRAAAFACTNQTCSLPVFESDKVAAMVDRLLTPPK